MNVIQISRNEGSLKSDVVLAIAELVKSIKPAPKSPALNKNKLQRPASAFASIGAKQEVKLKQAEPQNFHLCIEHTKLS